MSDGPAQSPPATTPPMVSPDGRHWWDGTAWVPMPNAKHAGPQPTRVAGAIVLAGGAIAAAGCFMPWLRMSAPLVGTITRTALSGDGMILLIAAVVAAMLGVMMLVRPTGRIVALCGLALGAVGVLIIAVDYSDLSSRVTHAQSGEARIIAEIGEGFYVAALGTMVWIVGTLMGWPRKRSTRPARL